VRIDPQHPSSVAYDPQHGLMREWHCRRRRREAAAAAATCPSHGAEAPHQTCFASTADCSVCVRSTKTAKVKAGPGACGKLGIEEHFAEREELRGVRHNRIGHKVDPAAHCKKGDARNYASDGHECRTTLPPVISMHTKTVKRPLRHLESSVRAIDRECALRHVVCTESCSNATGYRRFAARPAKLC
jgi:hypothetical protein